MDPRASGWLRVCDGAALREGGAVWRLDVRIGERPASALLLRAQGRVRGYLNRCAHVAMELDWQPGRVFDASGTWLVCATHGALYDPADGRCAGGPCRGRGGLRPIDAIERDGVVYWRPDDVVRAAD